MIRTLLLFAAVGGLAAMTAAQDLPSEEQAGHRRMKAAAEASQAAEASKKIELESEPDVAYEEVLKDPDNIDLNYRYARTEVRQGNLRGAAATLERILMVNPNLPKVRLFYAVVLYRLDNLDDAERELTALQAVEVPPTVREEMKDYLRLIAKRRRLTRISGRLGLGFDYDENRNAAPASGERLFFDIPVQLDSGSERKRDTALVTLANAFIIRDLQSQAGHQAFLSLSYYRADQNVVKIVNLQDYSAEAGLVYKTACGNFTPSFHFDDIFLGQSDYLRSRGARLRFDHRLSDPLSVFIETGYDYNDYSNTGIVPDGNDRSGDFSYATGGMTLWMSPAQMIFANIGYGYQGAKGNSLAYSRPTATLGHQWLLGRGQFFLTSLTADYDQYANPDPTISVKFRKDTTYRLRLTYGAPLGIVWAPLRDLVGTLSYEYYDSLSTITNYGYTNNKVSALFTYKWEW